MKYRPPKMATPRIARGMSRRGSCSLLAQRRGRLEPGEGEEPEHHPEEHRREARPARHREHREVQSVAVGGRARREPDQDDNAHDEYERDGSPLDNEQNPRAPPNVRGRERPHACEGYRADHEGRPPWLVRPDAEGVEELRPEDSGRGRGDDAVEGVSSHQRPPRDDAGPGAERRPDEAVHAAGVVEALGEPDEGPGDQQHPDGRQRERERDGAPDAARRALRVDVGRHRRRHKRQRDADRLPQMQLTPQVRSLGPTSFCGHNDSFARPKTSPFPRKCSQYLTPRAMVHSTRSSTPCEQAMIDA